MEKCARECILVDLMQSVSHWGYKTDVVPTLLRGSVLWDLVTWRHVLPEEVLLMQGLPVPGLVPDVLSRRFPFPAVLRGMDVAAKRSIAGNSMHAACVSAAFIWVLVS